MSEAHLKPVSGAPRPAQQLGGAPHGLAPPTAMADGQ